MVSALHSRLSCLASWSPGWALYVTFLGKTLNYQCLSPPRYILVTGEFCAGGKPGVEGEVTPTVYRNRDTFWPGGLLSLYTVNKPNLLSTAVV